MSQNMVYKDGRYQPWTNATGADVASGDVVEFADSIAVATEDIANGASGIVDTEGVYELALKAATAVSQGDQLYWDTVNDNVDKTNTNVPCGKAYADAEAGTATVLVKLNA